jgi:putative peptidoglycan lipid II flippase
MGAFQATELIRDNLASRLDEGSVTALTYGWFIMQVPQTIIGTAIGIALLPTLSELVSRGDEDGLRLTLNSSLRAMVALVFPVGAALFFLTRPFVEVLFEGRAFTPQATDMVVLAAKMYLLGLVGHSLLEIAARSFYAHRDAVTPMLVAIMAMGSQLLLSVILVRTPGLGYAGLALSNSLAFTLHAIILLAVLFVRFRAFDAGRVLKGWAKVSVSVGVMVIALAVFIGRQEQTSGFVQGAAGLLLAAVTYSVVSLLIRLEEAWQIIKNTLRYGRHR